MALTLEEKKARRVEGMKRAKAELTAVQAIHRSLTNGRPPVSELKTPFAAVSAARTLYGEISSRMRAAGLEDSKGAITVSVFYASTDLTTVSYTAPWWPGSEPNMESYLSGLIPIGLIFGIVDFDPRNIEGLVIGTRPFLALKQIDEWAEPLKAEYSDEAKAVAVLNGLRKVQVK